MPVAEVIDYIDAHRDRVVEGRKLGVEPICAVLREAGVQRDVELTKEITRVHTENLGVYGARKVWHELKRQGINVARCTVERLMRAAGLRGIPREKTRKTTCSAGAETPRPADKVNRQFVAAAPNRLWVADFSCRRRHEMSYADPRNVPMFSKGVLFCWVDGVMDRHSHNAVSQARMSGLGL